MVESGNSSLVVYLWSVDKSRRNLSRRGRGASMPITAPHRAREVPAALLAGDCASHSHLRE